MMTALVVMAIFTRLTSLDPFSLTGIETFQATSNIIEPLARTHPVSKELIPWLAESWSVDKPTNTFRVVLRPNVKFHNGDILSAEDVKFTFDAYFKPEFKGEIWRGMWEDIQEVKVTGPLTLEFKMKKLSFLTFLNVMTSLRILPRSFYSDGELEKFRTQIIGTGPFVLERFDSGRALELRPFPSWWGKPKAQINLLIKHVGESRLAEEMIRKGDLDFYVRPTSESRVKVGASSPKFRVLTNRAGSGEAIGISLNMRLPLFQDKRVREALLILWDRETLNNKLYGGQAELAVDMFSPKTLYYPKGKPVAFDRRRALRLLKNAGWADANKDSVLEKTIDGKTVNLSFTVLVNSAESERWVSLYAQDAKRVGVEVKMKRLEETSQWWHILNEGKFEAVADQGGVSESVHASTWRTKGAYNSLGFSDPGVDALLVNLEAEFDLKKRRALERALIEKVRAAGVSLPGLYMPGEQIYVSRRLDVDPMFPTQPWRWRLKD